MTISLKLLLSLLLPLLLGACVVPVVHGPHYRPVYPGAERIGGPTLSSALSPIAAPFQNPAVVENKVRQKMQAPQGEAWTRGPAGTSLRFKRGDCYMEANAHEVGGSFALDWYLERSTKCPRLSAENAPILVENLDSGKQYNVSLFQRLFSVSGPGLPSNEVVDLSAKLTGYREVPAAERQYTVSIWLQRAFNGELPEQLTIQLPPVWVSTRKAILPPLVLQRHGKFGSRFSNYEPLFLRTASNAGAIAQVWHEADGGLSLASRLWGWSDGKKWGDHYSSGIKGWIEFQVHSGVPIRLEANSLSWQQQGDEVPVDMPINRLDLMKYSTTRFDDSLAQLMTDKNSGKGMPYEDNSAHYNVQIPGPAPKHVRVTLPRILMDGDVWPIVPIEFEYQKGSVELLDAM